MTVSNQQYDLMYYRRGASLYRRGARFYRRGASFYRRGASFYHRGTTVGAQELLQFTLSMNN